MKPATILVFGLLICAILLFVSTTAEAEAAQNINPNGDAEYGAELFWGSCDHGCCSRNPKSKRCRVCCVSVEEAKVFSESMKDGMGRGGGGVTAKTEAGP